MTCILIIFLISALLAVDKKKKRKKKILSPQGTNILLFPELCEKFKELAIIICWTGEALGGKI